MKRHVNDDHFCLVLNIDVNVNVNATKRCVFFAGSPLLPMSINATNQRQREPYIKPAGLFLPTTRRPLFVSPCRHSLSSTFTTSAENLKGTINKSLTLRVKDNSTIYLEPVPAEATLKSVAGASMVKAVAFVEGAHAGMFGAELLSIGVRGRRLLRFFFFQYI